MKSFKALETLKSGQFTVINSVDKTKLSCYTLYSILSLETYTLHSIYSNQSYQTG